MISAMHCALWSHGSPPSDRSVVHIGLIGVTTGRRTEGPLVVAYPVTELVTPIRTARGVGTPVSLIAGTSSVPQWDGAGLWKGTKTVIPYIQWYQWLWGYRTLLLVAHLDCRFGALLALGCCCWHTKTPRELVASRQFPSCLRMCNVKAWTLQRLTRPMLL